MIELTEEQRQVVEHAGSEPATILDPKTRTPYVLIRQDVYEHLRELQEEEEERKIQAGWQKLAFRGIALSLDDEP